MIHLQLVLSHLVLLAGFCAFGQSDTIVFLGVNNLPAVESTAKSRIVIEQTGRNTYSLHTCHKHIFKSDKSIKKRSHKSKHIEDDSLNTATDSIKAPYEWRVLDTKLIKAENDSCYAIWDQEGKHGRYRWRFKNKDGTFHLLQFDPDGKLKRDSLLRQSSPSMMLKASSITSKH